mgnify:CR=1 FL=1
MVKIDTHPETGNFVGVSEEIGGNSEGEMSETKNTERFVYGIKLMCCLSDLFFKPNFTLNEKTVGNKSKEYIHSYDVDYIWYQAKKKHAKGEYLERRMV